MHNIMRCAIYPVEGGTTVCTCSVYACTVCVRAVVLLAGMHDCAIHKQITFGGISCNQLLSTNTSTTSDACIHMHYTLPATRAYSLYVGYVVVRGTVHVHHTCNYSLLMSGPTSHWKV